MRTENDVLECEQLVIGRHRLLIQRIERKAGDPPLLQSVEEGAAIDEVRV